MSLPAPSKKTVWQGIEDPLMKSPAVRSIVKDGKARVVGAIYDVGTGKVAWLPLEKVDGILKKVKASPDKETEPFAASAGARIPVHDSIHSSERSFTMSINFLSLFPEHSSLMVEAISSSHSSSMVRSPVSQLK